MLLKYYKYNIFIFIFIFILVHMTQHSTTLWINSPSFHLHSSTFTFAIYLSLFLSWFYLLHMFTFTESYLISNFKKQVISLLWSVITWAPKGKLKIFENQ